MHGSGKHRLARPHAAAAYGRLSKLLLAFVAVAVMCGTASLLLQARSAQLWPSPSAHPAGARELHLVDDVSNIHDQRHSNRQRHSSSSGAQSASASSVRLDGAHAGAQHVDELATLHQHDGMQPKMGTSARQGNTALLHKEMLPRHTITGHTHQAAEQVTSTFERPSSDAGVDDGVAAAPGSTGSDEQQAGNEAAPTPGTISLQSDDNSDRQPAGVSAASTEDTAVPNDTSGDVESVARGAQDQPATGDVGGSNSMPSTSAAAQPEHSTEDGTEHSTNADGRAARQSADEASDGSGVAAGMAPNAVPGAASLNASLDAPVPFKYPIWWHSPMWSGSGYGSEGINYVLSMLRSGLVAPRDLYAYNHGDNWQEHVVAAMDPTDRAELELLQSQPVQQAAEKRAAIVVCHSLPTNWAFPEPMWFSGAPCPPNPRDFGWVYAIGRTMFETDRLPASFVPRCNAMNEIWVPSEWSRQSFIASGVEASKLVVVPEGVNTTHLDPVLFTPLDLAAVGELVFGTPKSAAAMRRAASAATKAAATAARRAEQEARRKAAQTVQQPAPLVQAPTVQMQGHDAAGQQGAPVQQAAGAQTAVLQPALLDSLAAQHAQTAQHTVRPQAGGRKLMAEATQQQHSGNAPCRAARHSTNGVRERPFVFISSFKWEARKGWDVLLEAYLSEFSADDNVELYILTKPFMGSGNGFKDKMRSWADSRFAALHAQEQAAQAAARAAAAALATAAAAAAAAAAAGTHDGSLSGPHRRLADSGIPIAQHVPDLQQAQAPKSGAWQQYPTLYVVSSHISDEDFPRFYKAGDAFVLPSRGEGWGRPHVEAMSMGLPVISTNWSGITAYLDDTVGYPIKIEGLVPVQDLSESAWWFRGLKWAQPSVSHLRTLMRQVYTDRAGAARKGAAARQRMIEQYSPQVLAQRLVEEFRRVEAALEAVGPA